MVLVFLIAQKLVNDWLDIKLKQEIASDGEGDTEDTVPNIPPVLETSPHLKYDKFDGKNLCVNFKCFQEVFLF